MKYGVAVATSSEEEAQDVSSATSIKAQKSFSYSCSFSLSFYVSKIKDSPVNWGVFCYPSGQVRLGGTFRPRHNNWRKEDDQIDQCDPELIIHVKLFEGHRPRMRNEDPADQVNQDTNDTQNVPSLSTSRPRDSMANSHRYNYAKGNQNKFSNG